MLSDIRLMDQEQLKSFLKQHKQQAFRVKQILEWLWKKAVHSFDDMTNLSLELRKLLTENFEIRGIQTDKIQRSQDGTLKFRFRLYDGHLIESVLIPVPEDERYTVCVSSQVGCSLTCSFCATGKMKRIRNLDAAEIFDQVVLVSRECEKVYGRPITNVVYMGMGEPLLAYTEVMKSIELLTSPEALGMSPKRITISTAGIAKMIRKLADDSTRVNLALSLHASDDAKRDSIMPINEHNNLDALMSALKYYYEKTGNRISYEYIALRGFNDSLEDAARLSKLCRFFPVRVNIIEYNPIGDGLFDRSEENKVDEFARFLRAKSIMVTVRRSRGKDIDAACGQLAIKDQI
jgi:23S rRNA (adenine2503-C2)-methyltransferase